MASLNKVALLGNLTKDPEIKFTGQGTAVGSFSIATDESYFDKKTQKKVEAVEFHNITVWGKLAELSGEYLQKGSQVYLEGKLKTDKVEKDGVTKYYTKVVADQVQFLARTKKKGEAADAAEPEAKELPF